MLTQDSVSTYKVTLSNEAKSLNATIQVRSNEMIMDAAEREGLNLPVSCRAGACITCTGKLVEGVIEHLYCFLKRSEEEAGFVLPCMAYPLSDCIIRTHQEDELLDLSDRI